MIEVPEVRYPEIRDCAFRPMPKPQTRKQRISLRPGERPLNVIEIEICGKASKAIFSPNALIKAVVQNRAGLLRFLGEPGPDPSTISDREGTYQYRTDDVRLHLTFDEIERLTRRSLRPEEFLALKGKVRIFHEIHEDFYDPETGIAVQPK
jgi:hypothetical protein